MLSSFDAHIARRLTCCIFGLEPPHVLLARDEGLRQALLQGGIVCQHGRIGEVRTNLMQSTAVHARGLLS
eukprot:5081518-Prorocentrum_lima.AAC.1